MSSDYDPNYSRKPDPFIVGVKALIFNDEGKFLLLLRSSKTSSGGLWGLPGGAVDREEDIYDAMRREIREETQIEVDDVRLFTAKSRPHKEETVLILAFSCKARSKDIKLNWEHDDFAWVSKDESAKYDMTPDARFFTENYLNS